MTTPDDRAAAAAGPASIGNGAGAGGAAGSASLGNGADAGGAAGPASIADGAGAGGAAGSAGLGGGDHAGQPGGAAGSLAARQARLVATLTSAAPVPEGFDPRLVEIARVALLRKRAAEVAKSWPALAASHGREWRAAFAAWAAARPTQGSFRDGWDFAREVGAGSRADAAEELAGREAAYVYDGRNAPRPRRLPAVRRAGGGLIIQVAGRVRTLRRPG